MVLDHETTVWATCLVMFLLTGFGVFESLGCVQLLYVVWPRLCTSLQTLLLNKSILAITCFAILLAMQILSANLYGKVCQQAKLYSHRIALPDSKLRWPHLAQREPCRLNIPSWWRHQMETSSALLAMRGNPRSPVNSWNLPLTHTVIVCWVNSIALTSSKCAHAWIFLSQNGALWYICLVHCGIYRMGLLCIWCWSLKNIWMCIFLSSKVSIQ